MIELGGSGAKMMVNSSTGQKGPAYFFHNAGALCRGDKQLLTFWIREGRRDSIPVCMVLITLGCGLYGSIIGFRQGLEMACYVALKLPAIILLTLCVNGLLNGLLGLVLGSEIGLRQSLRFLLTGYAIMGLTLGALSPVILFINLNMPGPSADGALVGHAATLLLHTAVIAMAGILAHVRLLSCVREFAATRRAGAHTFMAWILGNLFVGAQISWNLRPFFVSPGLDVEFLRPDPFNGNFYEAAFRALQSLSLL